MDENFSKIQAEVWGTNDRSEISRLSTYGCHPGPIRRGLTKMEFPYTTTDELPSPLPTIKEIEDARNTKDDISLATPAFSLVVRVRDYAVKVGNDFLLQEAENMLYLEKHCPDLKMPKVYAVYAERYIFLVTAYVEGPSLYHHVWETVPPKAKENVLRKVGEQVRLLRAVPPPEPRYYGRIDGQPFVRNAHVYLPRQNYKNKYFCGPFFKHEDFAKAVWEAGMQSRTQRLHQNEFDPCQKMLMEGYDEIMARAAGQHPVLMHDDLQMHNVILVSNPDDPDDPDISIVDWAVLAWLPAYMQTARSFVKFSPEIGDTDSKRYLYEIVKGEKSSHLDTAYFMKEFLVRTRITG